MAQMVKSSINQLRIKFFNANDLQFCCEMIKRTSNNIPTLTHKQLYFAYSKTIYTALTHRCPVKLARQQVYIHICQTTASTLALIYYNTPICLCLCAGYAGRLRRGKTAGDAAPAAPGHCHRTNGLADDVRARGASQSTEEPQRYVRARVCYIYIYTHPLNVCVCIIYIPI